MKQNEEVDLPHPGQSDEELFQLFRKGERVGFELLVLKHHDRFYALAYRFLQNFELAEEIVQESFLGLWKKPQSWNPKRSKFTTWFYRVVSNRAIDLIRKQRVTSFLSEESGRLSVSNSEFFDNQKNEDLSDQLAVAIQRLPLNCRIAITLAYQEDLSHKEIAKIMKKSVRSVEALIYRAKNQLKSDLSASKAVLVNDKDE